MRRISSEFSSDFNIPLHLSSNAANMSGDSNDRLKYYLDMIFKSVLDRWF